jgi:Ser/Thr protein kinase RdoA (MazF antagonist)
MNNAQDAAKEEVFRAHLAERYGVRVTSLNRLDRGVFKVDLADGRCWIARIFPAKRPLAQVEGDAAILQFLEQQGFPAERCADAQPVSVLHGRGILVTTYIEGNAADADGRTLRAAGELLGRLNLLPIEAGAVARAAGALHHYAPEGGGLQQELDAAATWLTAIEDRVPQQHRPRYESLRAQVAAADNGHGLPEALIHPDPVLKNILATKGNDLVFIDWAGVGRGPRIASLATLIWSGALSKGRLSPRGVDAVVAGYRAQIRLDENELERLAAIMQIRPLVFACWRYRHAVLTDQMPDGTEWWWPSEELTQAIAARACAAFRAD